MLILYEFPISPFAQEAEMQAGEGRRQIGDHRLDWMMRAGGGPILAKRLEAGSVRFSDG